MNEVESVSSLRNLSRSGNQQNFFFKMSRMRKEESEKEERELKKEKGMNRKEWKRQREEDIERKEE